LLLRPRIARLWLIAAMLDMFLLYALYLRFLHWAGRVVICDRYVADTRIDFSRNFPNQFSTSHWLWRLLVAATPRPDIHFLLYVPIGVSLARSREKDEPFPDSPATLEYRLNEYLNATDFNLPEIVKIDCQSPIGLIQEEIQANVAKVNRF
jgi:thymidylate kinase